MNLATDDWQPIIFAPRDGRTFEARSKQGKIFGCRYSLQRRDFINTATNHRVRPQTWRPLRSGDPDHAA